MTSRWKLALLGVLALGALAVAAPASAQGDVGQFAPSCIPDRDCFVGCIQDAEECRAGAKKAGAECLRTECQDEREKREEACKSGERTRGCRAANLALQACISECRAEYNTAVEACISTARKCVADCVPDSLSNAD